MHTFEQLLEQCNPDEIPEMVARLKTKLARHRQTLNSQQSLLLIKLPPELLVEIGRHVLGKVTFKADKAWFRQVLPVLQTCVHLRAQLRPLFSTALICEMTVSADRIWDNVHKALAKWDKGGESYRGPVILIVNIKSMGGLSLSTAAAIAGALESAIYGSLYRACRLSTFGAQMCSSGAALAPSTMSAIVATTCLASPPMAGHTSR